jgi:hypothetical protein
MTEDLAKKRFFILTMIRFGGVISAFVGIAIIAKRWIEPADVIGGLFLANALIDVLVVPPLLIRRWRSAP